MPEPIADEFDGFDPALFGTWQERVAYGGQVPMADAELADEVRAVLEVKSADALGSASDELRRLLNDMTIEMREQFSTFRQMREGAVKALADGDDAAQKLARADVKAATDAMSLIVRTLEKVDSLQRQLARDREDEAERAADAGGYEEAKARFVQMIEDRAHEIAYGLFEEWKSTGPPAGTVEKFGRKGAEPADADKGSGGDSGEGVGGVEAKEPDPRDDLGGTQDGSRG